MVCEFILGSRIIDKKYLNPCNDSISEFMISWSDAQGLYKLADTESLKREAIFFQIDTFLLLTPLTLNCWATYWRTGQASENLYNYHLENVGQIYSNIINEFFPLSSNLAVFTADVFYEDWLSFAFYLGDSIYRTLVMKHTNTISLN